jgi:diaminopimelate decarboxylase
MFFHYQNKQLYAEQVPVADIAAQFGTPCYIYSRAGLEQNWRTFDQALQHPHRICYAVKANSNLAVLNILARLGSSFDIVSGGELARVLATGGKSENIIFSGVGKSTLEIQQALAANIYCFNVESEAELLRINAIAKQNNQRAPVALRINPDINVNTHPYISTGLKENKFGIAVAEALSLFIKNKSLQNISVIGIACHLGSQIITIDPYLQALDCLLTLITELKKQNINIQHIDLGGGFGVAYRGEQLPTITEFCNTIEKKLSTHNLELMLEPGRAIVANAGILVTRVEYLKHTAHKNFAIVDAAMNDLLRPALYQAWQNIIPVEPRDNVAENIYDVVGPVCETADFLGLERKLALQENDLLAICDVGAYGFVMSSNYNSRPRVAEIMVDRDQYFLIRQPEQVDMLFTTEHLLPNERF